MLSTAFRVRSRQAGLSASVPPRPHQRQLIHQHLYTRKATGTASSLLEVLRPPIAAVAADRIFASTRPYLPSHQPSCSTKSSPIPQSTEKIPTLRTTKGGKAPPSAPPPAPPKASKPSSINPPPTIEKKEQTPSRAKGPPPKGSAAKSPAPGPGPSSAVPPPLQPHDLPKLSYTRPSTPEKAQRAQSPVSRLPSPKSPERSKVSIPPPPKPSPKAEITKTDTKPSNSTTHRRVAGAKGASSGQASTPALVNLLPAEEIWTKSWQPPRLHSTTKPSTAESPLKSALKAPSPTTAMVPSARTLATKPTKTRDSPRRFPFQSFDTRDYLATRMELRSVSREIGLGLYSVILAGIEQNPGKTCDQIAGLLYTSIVKISEYRKVRSIVLKWMLQQEPTALWESVLEVAIIKPNVGLVAIHLAKHWVSPTPATLVFSLLHAYLVKIRAIIGRILGPQRTATPAAPTRHGRRQAPFKREIVPQVVPIAFVRKIIGKIGEKYAIGEFYRLIDTSLALEKLSTSQLNELLQFYAALSDKRKFYSVLGHFTAGSKAPNQWTLQWNAILIAQDPDEAVSIKLQELKRTFAEYWEKHKLLPNENTIEALVWIGLTGNIPALLGLVNEIMETHRIKPTAGILSELTEYLAHNGEAFKIYEQLVQAQQQFAIAPTEGMILCLRQALASASSLLPQQKQQIENYLSTFDEKKANSK